VFCLQAQSVERVCSISDGWRAYDGLVMVGHKHHRIHHHENEFARERRHMNGIESLWSYAKLRLQSFAAFARSTSMTTSKKPNGASTVAVKTSSTSRY
jgi:hypothetical protein